MSQTLGDERGVTAIESYAAIAFYAGVASLVTGAIRLARARIERRGARDRAGLALACAGLALTLVAVGTFVAGPRGVLPF